ncbi:MAG: hypothetical protein U9P80_04660 [Thermodesulfobacteriota bacterium]|nr:hypothetical protein [Thermodesulfobacteriota bacterium]
MDSETSKKVSDLISFMDDISSDIDILAELERFTKEITALKASLSSLTQRVDILEKDHKKKKEGLSQIQDEMRDLFSE